MSSTVFYTLPLVPCGAFFGTLVLLLIVPVFALVALGILLLLALGILITVAGAIISSPLLIARLASRHRSIGAGATALPRPRRHPTPHREEAVLHGMGRPG